MLKYPWRFFGANIDDWSPLAIFSGPPLQVRRRCGEGPTTQDLPMYPLYAFITICELFFARRITRSIRTQRIGNSETVKQGR